MGNRQTHAICTECKAAFMVPSIVPPNSELLCNNCKTITFCCGRCKQHSQKKGIPTGYSEEDCKHLDMLCDECSEQNRKAKHTIVTCSTCHSVINIYTENLTGGESNSIFSCTRCAAQRQDKHKAGEYKQIEVSDGQTSKRMMFTKELKPQAMATANMQQLMITAPPSGPRINAK